jgi:hypothetical protein
MTLDYLRNLKQTYILLLKQLQIQGTKAYKKFTPKLSYQKRKVKGIL